MHAKNSSIVAPIPNAERGDAPEVVMVADDEVPVYVFVDRPVVTAVEVGGV